MVSSEILIRFYVIFRLNIIIMVANNYLDVPTKISLIGFSEPHDFSLRDETEK